MLKVIEYNKEELLKTKLGKELYKKLIKIYNLDMWALGIMDFLYNDDVKIQKLIDLIDSGETDADKIFVYADKLERGLV